MQPFRDSLAPCPQILALHSTLRSPGTSPRIEGRINYHPITTPLMYIIDGLGMKKICDIGLSVHQARKNIVCARQRAPGIVQTLRPAREVFFKIRQGNGYDGACRTAFDGTHHHGLIFESANMAKHGCRCELDLRDGSHITA
jgi:hypothetical protein